MTVYLDSVAGRFVVFAIVAVDQDAHRVAETFGSGINDVTKCWPRGTEKRIAAMSSRAASEGPHPAAAGRETSR